MTLPNPKSKKFSPIQYPTLIICKEVLSKAGEDPDCATSRVNFQNELMLMKSYTNLEKTYKYFQNEVRFAALTHKHILPISHFGGWKQFSDVDKYYTYTITPFAENTFYHLFAQRMIRFDEQTALMYFRELISGVQYLHSQKVCHLDLNPEKIVLAEDLCLRITGFEYSRLEGDQGTLMEALTKYSAPELLLSEKKSIDYYKAEIYSLGVMLFTLVYGFDPFTKCKTLPWKGDSVTNSLGEFWKMMNGKCKIMHGEEFEDLLFKMVDMDPEKRPTLKEIKLHPWCNKKIHSEDLRKKLKEILSTEF